MLKLLHPFFLAKLHSIFTVNRNPMQVQYLPHSLVITITTATPAALHALIITAVANAGIMAMQLSNALTIEQRNAVAALMDLQKALLPGEAELEAIAGS
jgi:hypothetical protein